MTNHKDTVSVVVPVYNEEGTIEELHRRLVAVLEAESCPFEIIFVNDGSRDGTYEIAKQLRPLRLINLQKNYGETPAFDIGIQHATGDIIVFIDADLQDDPAEIPLLLREIRNGYDVAVGWRTKRYDVLSRIIFSKIANVFVRTILGLYIHDYGCGLKAYRSRFVKDFRLWGNAQVFLPVVAKQRGARICEVPVTNYIRKSGTSKMRIKSMMSTGFDLLGMAFFIRYFSNPFRFFGGWGLASLSLALAVFATAVVLRVFGIEDFTATPLPVVGTLFCILGILLFMMGLLAEMLLRMHYTATGHSPYMIRSINDQT